MLNLRDRKPVWHHTPFFTYLLHHGEIEWAYSLQCQAHTEVTYALYLFFIAGNLFSDATIFYSVRNDMFAEIKIPYAFIKCSEIFNLPNSISFIYYMDNFISSPVVFILIIFN